MLFLTTYSQNFVTFLHKKSISTSEPPKSFVCFLLLNINKVVVVVIAITSLKHKNEINSSDHEINY